MLKRLARRTDGITNLAGLLEHLQIALELEHATIPPYLCALYSIQEGHNQEAARVIRSVVMEEMLHMTLVANVLNALGGQPSVNHKEFVPTYPTTLPHSDGSFEVSLRKFSPEAVDTFLKIERPATPHSPPEAEHYHTIGQFYEAIEEGLKLVCKDGNPFKGDRKRQIGPEYYYGGGGAVVVVTNLESALRALTEIVEQGEGLPLAISDGDSKLLGEPEEPAHYFRFKEIQLGRCYQIADTPASGPRGPAFPVDWAAVYNMRPNPKIKDYERGGELHLAAEDFNRTYMTLLTLLHRSFNGEPNLLFDVVGVMYDLKYKAIRLMKIPFGDKETTAGPSFEYTCC